VVGEEGGLMWLALILTGILTVSAAVGPTTPTHLILPVGLLGLCLCGIGVKKLGSGAKRGAYEPMRRSAWRGRKCGSAGVVAVK
jgi:hypothetical protein